MSRGLKIVIIIGVLLRLVVWYLTPPNNSYDDYLEAIALYAEYLPVLSRLDPWACWQCYQPPFFGWCAAGLVELIHPLMSTQNTWKSVQLLNTVTSCGVLFLTAAAINKVLSEDDHEVAVVALTSVAAFLPRSLFSSAMISNDVFLQLGVALVVYGFAILFTARGPSLRSIGCIAFGVVFAAWSKQSGLLLCLPLLLVFATVFQSTSAQKQARPFMLGILGFSLFMAGSDEVWRFARAGIFLASNQDYFAYTAPQLPGSFAGVSFFDFRVAGLFADVFMTEATLPSFWTELFARTWFDYERRFFLPTPDTLKLGRVLYACGVMATVAVGWLSLKGVWRQRRRTAAIGLALIFAGFVFVPVVQTARFPVYSSMKAIFALPGLPALLLLAGLGVAEYAKERDCALLLRTLATIMLVAGCLTVLGVHLFSTEAWTGDLSGPMWPLPILD